MIDWFEVVKSALWIVGLATLLTLLGFARSFAHRSSREMLSTPTFRVVVAFGIAMFGIGVGLSSESWFERVGWIVIVLLSLWDGVDAVNARVRT